MKQIISALESSIAFNLSGTRKLVIGSEPVEVTDEEFSILSERLGAQVRESELGASRKSSGKQKEPLPEPVSETEEDL